MQVRVPHGFHGLEMPAAEWLPRGRNIRQLVGNVLGQIYFRQQYKAADDAEPTNMNAKVLQQFHGPKIHGNLIRYMLEQRFIIRDERYSHKGGVSMRYCWHPRFHGMGSEPYEITDKHILRAFTAHENERLEKQGILLQMEPIVTHMFGSMTDKVTILEQPAEAFMAMRQIQDPEFTVRQLEYALDGVKRISRGEFRITREPRGRVHHNITNLWGELRQFIRMGDDPCIQIDVKACFVGCLVRKLDSVYPDDPELEAEISEMRQQLLHGDFYSWLGELRNQTRGKIKKLVQIWLNGKWKDAPEFCRWMAVRFPTLTLRLKQMKQGQPKRWMYDELSRLEGGLMVDDIGARLVELRIDFFTVHDAVFVRTVDGPITLRIVKEALERSGIPAQVKVDEP